MGSTTMTDGTTTKRERGPLPQGEAARLLAAGAIPIFGSLTLLVTQATALNAAVLYLVAPLGVVIAAGVVWASSRRAKEPAAWLDDGNLLLRILGAAMMLPGIAVFIVGALAVPEATVALWPLVPLSCAIGVWLSFAGARRLRPEVLAALV